MDGLKIKLDQFTIQFFENTVMMRAANQIK